MYVSARNEIELCVDNCGDAMTWCRHVGCLIFCLRMKFCGGHFAMFKWSSFAKKKTKIKPWMRPCEPSRCHAVIKYIHWFDELCESHETRFHFASLLSVLSCRVLYWYLWCHFYRILICHQVSSKAICFGLWFVFYFAFVFLSLAPPDRHLFRCDASFRFAEFFFIRLVLCDVNNKNPSQS